MIGEQLVADVVEVSDQRHVDAELVELLANVRNGSSGLVTVHRDTNHFGTGARKGCDLRDGAFDVRGVGVGHRLHHDRCATANLDVADHNLNRAVAPLGAGLDGSGSFFQIAHFEIPFGAQISVFCDGEQGIATCLATAVYQI